MDSKVMDAILEGIHRGDSVYDLEHLGVSVRYLNALEESDFKVVFLEDLLKLDHCKLMQIPEIGPKAIKNILQGLNQYHLLEAKKQEREEYYQNCVEEYWKDPLPTSLKLDTYEEEEDEDEDEGGFVLEPLPIMEEKNV